jgi:hypothetical protein
MGGKTYFCNKNIVYMLNSFQSYLSSRNVRFDIRSNTVISFENNSYNYMFVFDESDPFYFRLILPNVFNVTEANKQDMYETINRMNTEIKAAKATIINNAVWVSIEQFVYSRDKIDELFNRAISVLEAFVNRFRSENKD